MRPSQTIYICGLECVSESGRLTDNVEVCARDFCPGSLAVILHHGSLPSDRSVRERKGRKLSEAEFSQWAGRSDSCYAVTEVGWLLSCRKSNYRLSLLLSAPHVERRNILICVFREKTLRDF